MLKIRKIITLLLVFVLMFTCTSCTIMGAHQKNIEPQISQMKTIAELAVMECYYHNVAKYKEEDAAGILLWKKDKYFWIEYNGIVKIGINASLLKIALNEEKVTITVPKVKILGGKVDEISLTKDSFIVAKASADISAEDEIKAFAEAQDNMAASAANDSALLASAQQRVEKLLEEYVMNIGEITGKNYIIEWNYVDSE